MKIENIGASHMAGVEYCIVEESSSKLNILILAKTVSNNYIKDETTTAAPDVCFMASQVKISSG